MSKSDEIKELKLQFPKITRFEAGEELELTGQEYESHIEDLWKLNKKQEEKIALEQEREKAKLVAESKLEKLGLTKEDLNLILA